MDLSTIFKFGGKVSVLIRAFKSQTIGEFKLADNEPFLKIDNIAVTFKYGKIDATATSGRQIHLNNNEEVLTGITLQGIPLNSRTSALIYTTLTGQQLTSGFEAVECENKTIVLQRDNVSDVFVYNSNRELVLNLTTAGKIITDDKLVDNEYTVFYNYAAESTPAYALNSPAISYLTIELFAKGNLDDNTSKAYLKLLRCKLNSSAKNTITYENTVNTINLEFDVIDGKTSDNYLIIG